MMETMTAAADQTGEMMVIDAAARIAGAPIAALTGEAATAAGAIAADKL